MNETRVLAFRERIYRGGTQTSKVDDSRTSSVFWLPYNQRGLVEFW